MHLKASLIALTVAVCLSASGSVTQSIKKPFAPLPIPIRAGKHDFVSVSAFSFTDHSGREWNAPVGTVTDGASIPQFCMAIVGPPMKDEYRGAALIHDAFCGKANEKGASYHRASWEAVHLMFYEACIAGGTPWWKAKTMYAAVYLFGPHDWIYDKGPAYFGGIRDMSRQQRDKKDREVLMILQREATKQYDVSSVSEPLKKAQLEELSKYIKAKNPEIKSLNNTMADVAQTLRETNQIKTLNVQ